LGHPNALRSQITKLKERFDIGRVVLIGDRGMNTKAAERPTLGPDVTIAIEEIDEHDTL
jgi:hypothetical protein